MTPISFKANFINTVPIKRNGKDIEASLVEFDTKNRHDITALQDVAYSWGIKTYAYDIYENAGKSYWDKGEKKSWQDPEHYYALTSQKDDFDNINFTEVLGVAELDEHDDCNELKYLQVKPKENFDSPKRNFSQIGTSILNSMKQLFSDKELMLFSNHSAIDFYKKNGFEQNESNLKFNEMSWKG